MSQPKYTFHRTSSATDHNIVYNFLQGYVAITRRMILTY